MTTLPPTLVRFEGELEQAIRRDLGLRRARTMRRRVLRIAAAGAAAAAVALGVLSTLPGDEPSLVDRAVAALAVDDDTILHFAMVGRQLNGDGTTATWRSESWQERWAPYERRSIEIGFDGIRAETHGVGDVSQLYDARTNTIYTGMPEAQAPPQQPAPSFAPGTRPGYVIVTVVKVSVDTNGNEVRHARKIEMSEDKAKVIVARSENPAPPAPAAPVEEPFREDILRLLRSGSAVEDGRLEIDGREVIRFVSRDGRQRYLIDARTYAPIEWHTSGDGGSVTLRFPTYEELPRSEANEALLSLTAQHPGARINRDPGDYEAAAARLFPHG